MLERHSYRLLSHRQTDLYMRIMSKNMQKNSIAREMSDVGGWRVTDRCCCFSSAANQVYLVSFLSLIPVATAALKTQKLIWWNNNLSTVKLCRHVNNITVVKFHTFCPGGPGGPGGPWRQTERFEITLRQREFSLAVIYYIQKIPQGLWDLQTQVDRQGLWYPAETNDTSH